jgi:hypothetical protein
VAKGGGIADFEIDTSATNGFEQDGIPGDDGVTVRLLTDFGNQADRRIGELTFSVIDPDQPQATQRLGLWKYSPEEASQLLRSAGGKSMLEARLPWQKALPNTKICCCSCGSELPMAVPWNGLPVSSCEPNSRPQAIRQWKADRRTRRSTREGKRMERPRIGGQFVSFDEKWLGMRASKPEKSENRL